MMKKCKHKNFEFSVQKEMLSYFSYDGKKLQHVKDVDYGYNHHYVEVTCSDCGKVIGEDEYTDKMMDAFGEIGV